MQCNVAIIGGGLVGMAMALSLKSLPLKTILIDAAPLEVHEDARLIALNANSIRLLQTLDVWKDLQPYAAAIEQVHVSQRGHFGTTRICCKDYKIPALGYVVPAKYINQVFYQALNKTDIQLIKPGKLNDLKQRANGVDLSITHESTTNTLHADVVIGADGSDSTVRELLQFPTEKIDYQQSALVTTTVLQRSHDHIAYERFQEAGAIAMLPLRENKAATIWTGDRARISALMQLSDDEFVRELQLFFGYRLGRFLKIEKRATYPLQMLSVKHPLQQHVLLIGNAAHTFHPIAAQGLNLALYEIDYLRQYFAQPRSQLSFSDLSMQSLQHEFSRQVSHHLTWIFSSQHFLVTAARQMGLMGMDILPGLKKFFALRAMGKANG